MRPAVAAAALVIGLAAQAPSAEVVRVEVDARQDIGGGAAYGLAGAYESFSGRMEFEIEPQAQANRNIADIDYAPLNSAGRVEFSANYFLLRPKDPARANGTILFEVSNRGGKGMLSMLNRAVGSRAPRTTAQMGDGFLLRNGFTLLWVGWQFDVPPGDDLLRVNVPAAAGRGEPIRGLVRSDFVLRQPGDVQSLGDRNMIPYPVADPAAAANVMTVRDAPLADREVVPRAQWRFARRDGNRLVDDPTSVWLEGGFEPNRIYEVVYEAKDPALAGLGLAAIRDAVSLLKHDSVRELELEAGDLPHAIAFGISQSGRLLRSFLYDGFNEDEQRRRVFDGVMPHIAGGARGSFNHRFAQPSRASWSYFYPNEVFPFADAEQDDLSGGVRGGLLTNVAADLQPKIFYTNSSNEYWRGSAALTHVSTDGRADLALPDNVRMYHFAGTQHVPTQFPPSSPTGQHPNNPNDYSAFLRALVMRMNAWIASGVPPPESRYPSLRDETLTTQAGLRFPAVPGAALPPPLLPVHRVDRGPEFAIARISTMEPPHVGPAYPLLLPQVDEDGNELAGLRSPELAVPLATYTGWSLFRRGAGPETELVSLQGSYIPFALSRAARETAGDPRRSIEERYPTRAHYLGLVTEHALGLIEQGYMLGEDLPWAAARAVQRWDHALGAAVDDAVGDAADSTSDPPQ